MLLTSLLVLLGVAVAVGTIDGLQAAQGVVAGGVVMVGSMAITAMALRPGVPVHLASGVVSAKLPMLGLAAWLLFSVFPVLPVVLGGSSVVVAAVALSLIDRLAPAQPAEA